MNGGGGGGGDDPIPGDRVDAGKSGALNKEQRGGIVGHSVGGSQRVLKGQIRRKIGDRVRAVVIGDLQRGIKANPFQGQFLGDDDLDLGASSLELLLAKNRGDEPRRGKKDSRESPRPGAGSLAREL